MQLFKGCFNCNRTNRKLFFDEWVEKMKPCNKEYQKHSEILRWIDEEKRQGNFTY